MTTGETSSSLEGRAMLASDLLRVGERHPLGVNAEVFMKQKASARRRRKRAWYKDLLLNPWTHRWAIFLLKIADIVRQWF